MSIGSVVGMFKAFLFLFPFVLELFFGKAPNPYSRNPRDWQNGKPSKPWVRIVFISIGISSMAINSYLMVRLFHLGTSHVVQTKELTKERSEKVELANLLTVCAAPKVEAAPVVAPVVQVEPVVKALTKEPAKAVKRNPKKSTDSELKNHRVFIERLKTLDDL